MKVAQSCPILYNPMDCSLPASSDPGILPGRRSGAKHIIETLCVLVKEASLFFFFRLPIATHGLSPVAAKQ